MAALPSRRILCAQVLEKPPWVAGLTGRLRPCPPRPSPYRPGTLTVLTKVAESRPGRFTRVFAITSVITIMGNMGGWTRNVKEQQSTIYQYVKWISGSLEQQPALLFRRWPSPPSPADNSLMQRTCSGPGETVTDQDPGFQLDTHERRHGSGRISRRRNPTCGQQSRVTGPGRRFGRHIGGGHLRTSRSRVRG